MALPITALYAGLLAFWSMYLQFKVVRFRRTQKVALGDGGKDEGLRLTRAHGNATETIPIFLIMMALAEGLSTPGWVLHILAIAFCAGRVIHGLHFMKEREGYKLRFYGMLTTLITTGLMALGLIGHAVI